MFCGTLKIFTKMMLCRIGPRHSMPTFMIEPEKSEIAGLLSKPYRKTLPYPNQLSNVRSKIWKTLDTSLQNKDGEPTAEKAVCCFVFFDSPFFCTHRLVEWKRKTKPQVTPRGNCALTWPVVWGNMNWEVEPPSGTIYIQRRNNNQYLFKCYFSGLNLSRR